MSQEIEEIIDLIAEASRVSSHARRAYELLRRQYNLPPIESRQELIAGRMGYAA